MSNASGTLLAQFTAGDAAVNIIYTAPTNLRIEVTRILVANRNAGAQVFEVYHSNTGGGGANSNMIIINSLAATDTFDFATQGPNGGLHLERGATLSFKDPSAGDLTISVYGIAQQTTQRGV